MQHNEEFDLLSPATRSIFSEDPHQEFQLLYKTIEDQKKLISGLVTQQAQDKKEWGLVQQLNVDVLSQYNTQVAANQRLAAQLAEAKATQLAQQAELNKLRAEIAHIKQTAENQLLGTVGHLQSGILSMANDPRLFHRCGSAAAAVASSAPQAGSASPFLTSSKKK